MEMRFINDRAAPDYFCAVLLTKDGKYAGRCRHKHRSWEAMKRCAYACEVEPLVIIHDLRVRWGGVYNGWVWVYDGSWNPIHKLEKEG